MSTTRFIAVFEGEIPKDQTDVVWRPWIKAAGDPLLPQLAAHRHMRDRGGLAPDDKPLTLFVCIRKTETWPSVDCHEFLITRT